MSAQVADRIDFKAVDPSSGLVPALIWGKLKQSAGHGPVVIVLNGTVCAVSEIFRQEGAPSFAGFANDALFRPGANDLALYELIEGKQPQLRPIAIG